MNQTIDFSPRAVSRAVMRRTLQRPHVLYPAAVGILGGVAAAVLGPTMLFVAPAVAGSALALGGWGLDFALRRERHAADYLRQLQAALAGRVDETLQRLDSEFEKLAFAPGRAQIRQLKDKYAAFETLLRRKFNPAELTYTRYLGMTEQVFLAGLDNLSRIADTLQGLSAIDQNHVKARLHHLHNDGIESEAQDLEISALNERLALLERQRARIDGWLSENERAMTQIDQTMAAIATLDTAAGHAQLDIESAMQELKQLADRAPAYSAQSQGTTG